MKRRQYLAGLGAGIGLAAGVSDAGVRRAGASFAEDLGCTAGYRPDRFDELNAFEPNAVYAVEQPDDLVAGDAEADAFVSDVRDAAQEGEVLLARKRQIDVGMPHEYRAYGLDGDVYREVAREESQTYVTAFFPDAHENMVRTPCIDRTGPFENGDL